MWSFALICKIRCCLFSEELLEMKRDGNIKRMPKLIKWKAQLLNIAQFNFLDSLRDL